MQTEQEINDELESLAGGPRRAFHLAKLARQAEQTVSGDRFKISPPKRTKETVFISLAKRDHYLQEAINFYVKYFL